MKTELQWLAAQYRQHRADEVAKERPQRQAELAELEAKIDGLNGSPWQAALRRRAELHNWLTSNPAPEVLALQRELRAEYEQHVAASGVCEAIALRLCPKCKAANQAMVLAQRLCLRPVDDIESERAAIAKAASRCVRGMRRLADVFQNEFTFSPIPESVRKLSRKEKLSRGLAKRTRAEILAGAIQ